MLSLFGALLTFYHFCIIVTFPRDLLQELDGRPLRVNSGPAPPSSVRRDGPPSRMMGRGGGSSSSSNRVYVGNLSWGVDDLALETLFREQGNVVEAKVIYDRESGRSRGFGFVTYNSAKDVDNAIDSLNGAVSIYPQMFSLLNSCFVT